MIRRILYLKAILLAITLALFINAGVSYAADFNENELQKLFTSPEQRQNLDAARRGAFVSNNATGASSSNIQMNGLLKRSKGKSVVWINGKNTMESNRVDGVRVLSKTYKKRVGVKVEDRVIYLKPGQKWSEDTNKVIDKY